MSADNDLHCFDSVREIKIKPLRHWGSNEQISTTLTALSRSEALRRKVDPSSGTLIESSSVGKKTDSRIRVDLSSPNSIFDSTSSVVKCLGFPNHLRVCLSTSVPAEVDEVVFRDPDSVNQREVVTNIDNVSQRLNQGGCAATRLPGAKIKPANPIQMKEACQSLARFAAEWRWQQDT